MIVKSINDIFLELQMPCIKANFNFYILIKVFKDHLYLLFIKNIANQKITNAKESAAITLLELIIK